MPSRSISIRLGVQDADTVKRALQTLGADGQRALARIEQGSQPASRGLLAVNAASQQARAGLEGMAARAGPLGSILLALGPAGLAAAAGIAAITAGVSRAVRAASTLQVEMRTLEGVLRATGRESEVTAEDIDALARAIDLGTLGSASELRRAAAQLLTFGDISEETFGRALRLSQDLASLGFGSVASAAQRLGRTLEAPVENLSSLRRIGIQFTEGQKELIATLVETGRAAEAQEIILSELESRIGGAAGAQADGTLAGAVDTLSFRWTELLETLGDSGPLDLTTQTVNGLADAIEGLTGAMQALGDIPPLPAILFRMRDPVGFAAAQEMGQLGLNTEMFSPLPDPASSGSGGSGSGSGQGSGGGTSAAEREAERRRQAIDDMAFETQQLIRLADAHRDGAAAVEEAALQNEVLATARRLGVEAGTEEFRYLQDIVAVRDRYAGIVERQVDIQREAARVIEATRTAEEQLAIETERLNDLFEVGAINGETYERAVADLNDRLTETSDIARDVSAEMSSFLRTLITDFDNAGEAALRFLARIAEGQFNQRVADPLSDALGGVIDAGIGSLFGGGGGGGNFARPGGGFFLEFHRGGRVGETPAPVRLESPDLLQGARRFHNGLRHDEFPAILQKGETVLPRGTEPGGVNVIVNNYTPAEVETRQRGPSLELTIRDGLRGEVERGNLDGAMSRRYGIRPTAQRGAF